MQQWLVIGVSGVTCGGKTTLARNLRDYFKSQRNVQLWNTPYTISDVQLLSQDDYFLPVDDLRHKWNGKLNVINFELLSSLDMKQMLSDIAWTMKGRYLAADPIMENIDYINKISMSTNFEHYAPQLPQYRHHYHPHASSHHQHPQSILPGINTPHIIRVNSQLPTQLRENKINILILEGFMIFNQPELLTLCNIKFHFHLPYEKCFERRRKRTYEPPDVTGYFEICVWPHYENNFTEFRDRKDITFLNGEIGREKIFQFVIQKIMTYFEERCGDVASPPPQKFLQIQNIPNSCNANSSGSLTKTCHMEQHME